MTGHAGAIQSDKTETSDRYCWGSEVMVLPGVYSGVPLHQCARGGCSEVEDTLGVSPADLCAIVAAQQRIVEPFDGIGHALVGVVDREQQPVAADLADRVEQRGVEMPAGGQDEVVVEVLTHLAPGPAQAGALTLLVQPVL